MRVALEDKLITMGRPVGLWLAALLGDAGVVACTCTKGTTATAEAKCVSCFGTKRAPGFFRFGYETVHASSSAAAAGGYVLTSCVVDTTLKPNRVALAAGALTGTVLSPALVYSNPQAADWTTDLRAYRRDAAQTVAAEFSTDGVSWVALASINGTAKPSGTGTLRFRVTLIRTATTQESPSFEIVRARHAQPELLTVRMRRARPDLTVGTVLVMKTSVTEQVLRHAVLGRVAEHQSDRSWTAPLDLYTSSIAFGAVAARLADTGEGPHHFFRPLQGLDVDETYVISQIRYSEQAEGLFVSQSFDERRVQSGESPSLVW